MYPVSTQPDASAGYAPYERMKSPTHDYSQRYSYSRTRIDPPRPLEPRPTLNISLSESSGRPQRHEVFHTPISTNSEYGSQSRNLPGLRDILSPGRQTNSSYGDPWSSSTTSNIGQHGSEPYRHTAGLHPPMTLHPSSEPTQTYQPPFARAFELPVLETSPVTKHIPQSLPVSPYAGYPEAARDYTESHLDRQAQSSRNSYVTNGIPSAYSQSESQSQPAASPYVANGMSSPYASASADEPLRRRRLSKSDRGGNAPYIQGAAETHGKYLGVEDVPGDGRFYVYEDGYRIPTQVDGEQVNPAWGLTKANKPRRRLALACLDCREKKIKCEPGLARCVQCEKAMRPCRK